MLKFFFFFNKKKLFYSEMTSISEDDIIQTLESLNMLKYWDGETDVYITPNFVDEHIQSAQFKRPRLTVEPSALNWHPPRKLNKPLIPEQDSD